MTYVIADKVECNGSLRYLPELVTDDLEQAKRLCTPNARTLRCWRPVVIEWTGDEPPEVCDGSLHSYPYLTPGEIQGKVVYP